MKSQLGFHTLVLASLLLISLAPDVSFACRCLTDPYSKTYEYVEKTWYGSRRKWSCRYTCEDFNGNRAELTGWQKDWNLGVDQGLEGVCEGTVYEAEFSRATLDYVWVLRGAEWFDARKTKSLEIKGWVLANCR